ncbi:hypothetical protein Tco_0366947 [Tanacetum coccineum]
MITEEMMQTKHYRMYAEVFGLDVPLTQSQPTESTQRTHRTPSAPRSPTPKKDTSESSAPKRSTVIRFRLPKRRSTRLTPPAPVSTVDKADEMILQDTLQVSLVEHKSREEQEARENVELVNKHLASEETKKMIEGSENVIDDSLPLEQMLTKDSQALYVKGRLSYLFKHLIREIVARKSFDSLANTLQEVLVTITTPMVDTHIKEQVKKQVPEQVRDQVPVVSSSGQVNEEERDDDEILMKQVSQDIMEEVSLTIDEAKLKKMVDEMLRQRCTLGDEHQYHIDQMKNFLKSDIVWESRKEILVSPHP